MTKDRVLGRVPERGDLILRSFNTTLGYLKFPKEFVDKFSKLNVKNITSPEVSVESYGGRVSLIYSWDEMEMDNWAPSKTDFEVQPDVIQRNPNLRLGYLRFPKGFTEKVTKRPIPSPGFRIEEANGVVRLIFFWKVKDLVG